MAKPLDRAELKKAADELTDVLYWSSGLELELTRERTLAALTDIAKRALEQGAWRPSRYREVCAALDEPKDSAT